MQTLCEDMIIKDESLRVVCKVCGLFSNGAQSIDDMTPLNDEYCDPMGLDIEQVVIFLP